MKKTSKFFQKRYPLKTASGFFKKQPVYSLIKSRTANLPHSKSGFYN